MTSRQGSLRGARAGISWGVTSLGVGSGALVGVSTGLVAMAQVRQHQDNNRTAGCDMPQGFLLHPTKTDVTIYRLKQPGHKIAVFAKL